MSTALIIMAAGIWGGVADLLGFQAFRSLRETLVVVGPTIAALLYSVAPDLSTLSADTLIWLAVIGPVLAVMTTAFTVDHILSVLDRRSAEQEG